MGTSRFRARFAWSGLIGVSLVVGLAPVLLAHALASATLCVMRRGALPPLWDEVRERVARQPAHMERLRASGGLRAK